MEWKRTGEDDAAERAHGLNEAQPLRLLWLTSPERRPKSPESPTQLGFSGCLGQSQRSFMGVKVDITLF
jgi:hypothetical protein